MYMDEKTEKIQFKISTKEGIQTLFQMIIVL